MPQPASRSGIEEAGPGKRHRQDEGQQQRRGRTGEYRADDAGEHHREPDDAIVPPRARRCARRASRGDQRAAGDGERRLRLEPLAHRAPEIDQQQHRERAEGGERREHRIGDHLVADGEHRRHHDAARAAARAPRTRGRALAASSAASLTRSSSGRQPAPRPPGRRRQSRAARRRERPRPVRSVSLARARSAAGATSSATATEVACNSRPGISVARANPPAATARRTDRDLALPVTPSAPERVADHHGRRGAEFTRSGDAELAREAIGITR